MSTLIDFINTLPDFMNTLLDSMSALLDSQFARRNFHVKTINSILDRPSSCPAIVVPFRTRNKLSSRFQTLEKHPHRQILAATF